jgi:glutamate-5-semialdehyde dehydrogenase
MAQAIKNNKQQILSQNILDLEYAKENKLSLALTDRLLLDDTRIESMADAIKDIAMLKEPIGRVIDGWVNDDGLKIEKVSVPIGVVGIIYESRPNVTSDTAALNFKSGNVCILKGGKEAINSNRIITEILQDVLEKNSLPKEAISLIPDSSREGVAKLITQDQYLDLIIPRGGEALIKFINKNATVPVVKHDKGLCHTYIDKDALKEDAISIAINAKCDRPGVCNAMETLLIDKAIAKELLPTLKKEFDSYHTKLLGDDLTQNIIDINRATQEDYQTEYLDNILSIKIVDGVDDAIAHINKYGSRHSEAIITQNYTTSQRFLDAVDASCVYVNASTRFTDGGVFGFGAEVGISTNKLHARGPMGINDLTTYKYKIYGNGQIR